MPVLESVCRKSAGRCRLWRAFVITPRPTAVLRTSKTSQYRVRPFDEGRGSVYDTARLPPFIFEMRAAGAGTFAVSSKNHVKQN
jgi:hypothetical protein